MENDYSEKEIVDAIRRAVDNVNCLSQKAATIGLIVEFETADVKNLNSKGWFELITPHIRKEEITHF